MEHESTESQQAIRSAPPTPVVTQTEAAKLSGFSRRQIENLIADGQLATLQVGPRLMVTRYSLTALLRQVDGVAA